MTAVAALVHPVLRSSPRHVRADLHVVHLLDAAAEVDPLFELIAPENHALRRSLDSPLLRWRAARDVESAAGVVVAWGENAFEACRRSHVRTVIYRPSPALRRPPAFSKGRGGPPIVVVNGRPQLDRFRRAGWPASRIRVVVPPVARLRGPVLKSAPREFRWLLSADASGDAGLREAIWSATLLFFMERPHRLHRLLICGDGINQRRAKHFVDQLGQPGLALPLPRTRVEQAVWQADAALLVSTGPTDPLTAAAVAVAGIPAVIHGKGDDGTLLAGRPNVHVSPDTRPRVVTREMLRLIESGAEVIPGDGRFLPEAVRRAWFGVIEGIAPATAS